MPDHVDPRTLALKVWAGKTGWWSPTLPDQNLDHPEGWVLVPSGNAGLTRRLTKGPHWIVMEKDGRYSQRVGLLAPKDVVDAAEAAFEAGADERKKANTRSGRARKEAEQRYREEFAAAVVTYLAFAPEHAVLAQSIARTTAEQACEVGSGRVGRSGQLDLATAARLAVRAHIRHAHTDYEQDLADVRGEAGFVGQDDYADVRDEARFAVHAFIERHRTPTHVDESRRSSPRA